MTIKRSIAGVITMGVIATTLTACSFGGHKEVGPSGIKEFNPTKFGISSDTVTKEEEHIWKFQRDSAVSTASTEESVGYTEETEGYDSSDHIGELILNGEDTSADWTVDGEDIIYANRRYHELYSNMQKVESPYDVNTMINFILKMYEARENEIYTNLVDYNRISEEINSTEHEEGTDNTNSTIDEILEGSEKYREIKAKYNDKASWIIEICTYGGKNKGNIIGCKSFMCLMNTDDDTIIDMSNYNETSGEELNNTTQEVPEEEEEETPEKVEESKKNNVNEE